NVVSHVDDFYSGARNSMTYEFFPLAYRLPPHAGKGYAQGQPFMSRHFCIGCTIATVVALMASTEAIAQDFRPLDRMPGTIVGTVIDANGDTVPGATVVLRDLDANTDRAQVTSENGFFSFQTINPGTPYQVSVTAKDFAEWKSPAITLQPAQY